MHSTPDQSTTFDVVPTQDGMGYMVELCKDGNCSRAFISSMHLVDSKRPQLEGSLKN